MNLKKEKVFSIYNKLYGNVDNMVLVKVNLCIIYVKYRFELVYFLWIVIKCCFLFYLIKDFIKVLIVICILIYVL